MSKSGLMRLIALAVLLNGCATVSITDHSGNTRVQSHFGVISIELSPRASAVVAEAWSFGYLTGPMGTTLGIEHMRVAALPEDCRMVVWLERPEHIEALKQQIGEMKDLCLINPLKTEIEPWNPGTSF